MVNEATSTNITGGTTPTGGTIIIRDGSGSIIPNGQNTIASGGSKMATGTTIIIGATVTGGSTSTRNGSRSITRIGSHGMTIGKTTITGIEQSAPASWPMRIEQVAESTARRSCPHPQEIDRARGSPSLRRFLFQKVRCCSRLLVLQRTHCGLSKQHHSA